MRIQATSGYGPFGTGHDWFNVLDIWNIFGDEFLDFYYRVNYYFLSSIFIKWKNSNFFWVFLYFFPEFSAIFFRKLFFYQFFADQRVLIFLIFFRMHQAAAKGRVNNSSPCTKSIYASHSTSLTVIHFKFYPDWVKIQKYVFFTIWRQRRFTSIWNFLEKGTDFVILGFALCQKIQNEMSCTSLY